jgi:hypothetical protein
MAEMAETGKIVVVVKMIVTIVVTKKNVMIKLFSLICQMVMFHPIMNT